MLGVFFSKFDRSLNKN